MTPKTRQIVYMLIAIAASAATMVIVTELTRGEIDGLPGLALSTAAAVAVYTALSRWLHGVPPKD